MPDLVHDWWWALPAALFAAGVVVRLVPPWHRRVDEWLSREIRAPRAVLIIQTFRDIAVPVIAVVVAFLWWQAATRDEEADRNARIQSCSSVYAATYSAWDGRVVKLDQQADTVFARLIADSRGSADVGQDRIDEYTEARDAAERASDVVDEMARRRIGLGVYSAVSVERGNDFQCPRLPRRLMVEAVYPDGFDP
jgi:hypothetical protein